MTGVIPRKRGGSGGTDEASKLVSTAIVGTGTIPAGKLLSFDDVVLIDGKTEVALADKDDLRSNQALAWSLTGGSAGETIKVLEYGLTPFDTSGGITKQLLYLGNDGDVLFDKPSAGVQQIVGIIRYSNSSGDFLFNPELSKETTPGGSPTKNQSLNGTGVLRGGIISLLSGTEIEGNAGFGEIVFTDNPVGNIAIPVSWDDFTYTVDTSVDGIYVLICDDSGVFSQVLIDNYNEATRRDYLTFGTFTVSANVTTSCTPFVLSSNEPLQQFFDLLNCLGTIRCKGLDVSPTGANLQVNLSSGIIHAVGSGAQLGGRSQNLTSVNGQSPMVFDRLLGKTNTKPVGGTRVDVIDPDFWDDGSGSPVSVGGVNKATIKYVFLLPSPNVAVAVMYGQSVYNTLADAVAAGADDNIEVPELYAKNALLVGRIAVISGASDLSNPDQARFLGGAKFGSGLAGGSTGGSGGGGNVIGAASSNAGEVPTFADASGLVLDSNSDVSALSGVLSRIGVGNLILRASTSKPIEFDNSTGDTDVLVSAPAGGKAGFSFRIDNVGVGGVGASNAGYLKFGIGSYNNALNGVIVNENGWVSVGNRLTTSDELNSIAFGIFATDRGFKPPVLTNAQRNAIVGPVDGLTIYNSDAKELQPYNVSLNAWGKAKATLHSANNTNPSATSGTGYVPMQIGSSSLIGQIGFTGLDSRTIRYNGPSSTFSIRLTTNIRSADGQATSPYRWEVTVSVNGSAVLPTATTQVMNGNDGSNVVLDLQNVTLNTNDAISLRIRQTSGAIETQPIAKNTTLEVKEY